MSDTAPGMPAGDFQLDPRLAADSVFVADGPLSQVRLMDDARFP
ncbi:diadenosine tetraphosphate hydrolase, partial [Xanthomonas vasicola]